MGSNGLETQHSSFKQCSHPLGHPLALSHPSSEFLPFFLPISVFYWFFPSVGKIATNYPLFGIVEVDGKQWAQYSRALNTHHSNSVLTFLPIIPWSQLTLILDFSLLWISPFFFQFFTAFPPFKKSELLDKMLQRTFPWDEVLILELCLGAIKSFLNN